MEKRDRGSWPDLFTPDLLPRISLRRLALLSGGDLGLLDIAHFTFTIRSRHVPWCQPTIIGDRKKRCFPTALLEDLNALHFIDILEAAAVLTVAVKSEHLVTLSRQTQLFSAGAARIRLVGDISGREKALNKVWPGGAC